MERIEEWKKHYQRSSDYLMKARESQRKRTSAMFELFNHRLNNLKDGGLFSDKDERSQALIKEASECLSDMVFNGLRSIAEATTSFEISIIENEDVYAAFDNNNFSFIYTYLQSLDQIVLTELKNIAKEIALFDLLDYVSKDLSESNLTDKEPKAFMSVVELLKS